MKNNRSITGIIILTCSVLLCVIIGIHAIPGIRMECNFKAELRRLEQEVETTPVYVTHKRSVNVDGTSFNIGDIIEKATNISTSFAAMMDFANMDIWDQTPSFRYLIVYNMMAVSCTSYAESSAIMGSLMR